MNNDSYKNLSNIASFFKKLPISGLEVITRQFGFICENVLGVENYFFHAIADQLNQLSPRFYISEKLRAITIQSLVENPPLYDGFAEKNFDDYVDKQLQDRTWVEEPTIRVLARALGLNIVIIQDDCTEPTIIKCSQE